MLAKIGIYTNSPVGAKPQALLTIGGISIVTQSPPTVLGAGRCEHERRRRRLDQSAS